MTDEEKARAATDEYRSYLLNEGECNIDEAHDAADGFYFGYLAALADLRKGEPDGWIQERPDGQFESSGDGSLSVYATESEAKGYYGTGKPRPVRLIYLDEGEWTEKKEG